MTTDLPKLQLGTIALDVPIVQAALSGYSDWPMRVLARRLGAPFTLCEVMLDQFVLKVKENRKNRHFFHISDEEHPVGGQLMGAEADEFSAGALKLVEAGFDVIDINFGCPVKKVLGRSRGGYHLGQPEVALQIVQKTRDAVPNHIPVTVKMRRGIDDSQQSRDNFFTILDGAFALGVAAVTVHGRTVNQRYIGPSRWEFLREVKQHVADHTILGSGDLFTAKDCLEMLQQTGIDGVSVARGAIGNPWIFQQARALFAGQPLPDPPSIHQQREIIEEHFRLSEQVYDNRCGQIMRKFGIKYSALHPQSKRVREAFVKIQKRSDWESVLEKWYTEDLPGRYPGLDFHTAQSSCEQSI